MNYGKLTAGTTKTAIDTAKPSEKGEIITYLSRMGDVLENVDERRHVVVHLICTVYTVIDGDEADIVVRENHLRVHTHLKIVPSQSAHIFHDNGTDTPFVDHTEQALPVRTIKICSAVTIVYEISRIGESVIVGILFQNSFLVHDAVAFTL